MGFLRHSRIYLRKALRIMRASHVHYRKSMPPTRPGPATGTGSQGVMHSRLVDGHSTVEDHMFRAI